MRALRTAFLTLSLILAVFSSCSLFPSDSVKSASSEIKNGALVLDVRSTNEFEEAHIEGAINIPHNQIANRISEISGSKDQSIVVYCRSGRRAGIAEQALQAAGYTKVLNAGGYAGLKRALKQ